jgi:para-nitrobenzyl esterase
VIEVRTGHGALRGHTVGGVTSFKGISYAAAPFGRNRFRAPQPVEPWDGVRDAGVFGATAPMPGYRPPFEHLLPNPIIEGDACLNLNVWTPDPGARGLPVMVWVPGGAFVNGSSAVPLYDGSAFARDGVVLVSVNYRLGVDGFLDFGDGVQAAANRGLLDQIAALEWVQANIEAFGGDPGRVTVFGESAGAMSIGALLSSARAEGLFARAILQSGAGHHAVTPATAALVRGELAQRLGGPATREALAEVPRERLVATQAALTLDAQQTPDPARWGEIALNSMAFEPVVDGDLVTDLPIRAIAAGAARGVGVLLGTTAGEHRLFLVPNGIADAVTEPMLAGLGAAYGLDVDPALESYRARRPDASPGYVMADVISDWFFRIPAIRLAEARAAHGLPVWAYEFAWSSPAYDGRLGSCHALEIGFVFDTLGHPSAGAMVGTTPPQALADEIHRAWVAFATDGEPGWPPYETERRCTMRFAVPASEVVRDPRGEERRQWASAR